MHMLVKGLILLGFVAMSQAFLKGRPPKFMPVRPIIKKVPYIKKQFIPIVKKVEVKVPAPFPVYVERKVQVPVYIERQVLVNDKGSGMVGGGVAADIGISANDADNINVFTSVGGAAAGVPFDNNFDNGLNLDNGLNIDNGLNNNGFDNGGFDNGGFDNGGFVDSGIIDGQIGGGHIDGPIGGGQQLVHHQEVQSHGQTFQHVDAGIGGGKKGGLPPQGHF